MSLTLDESVEINAARRMDSAAFKRIDSPQYMETYRYLILGRSFAPFNTNSIQSNNLITLTQPIVSCWFN